MSAQHTPGRVAFDAAVTHAKNALSHRSYARECKARYNHYDAREAERVARWNEQRVRDIADAAIAKATGGAS